MRGRFISPNKQMGCYIEREVFTLLDRELFQETDVGIVMRCAFLLPWDVPFGDRASLLILGMFVTESRNTHGKVAFRLWFSLQQIIYDRFL